MLTPKQWGFGKIKKGSIFYGSCFAVKFDTLENGALMHGMEVNTLIGQLEQFLKTLPIPIASAQHK